MTELEKANIIISEVCKYLKQDREKVMTKCRKREQVEVRQLASYFMNRKTTLSLTAIGLYFKQDHATIIHSIATISNLVKYNGFSEKTKPIAARINIALLKAEKGDSIMWEFRLKRIRFHYRAMRAKAGRLRAICTASKLLAEVNIESF